MSGLNLGWVISEVTVFGSGEFSGANLCDVLTYSCVGGIAEAGEVFEEAGFEGGIQSEHIGADENLSGADWSGPDADGGDGETFGDALSDVGGNKFEDDGEGAGIFSGAGIVEELLFVALNAAHATQLPDGLGAHADVRHDGYVCSANAANCFRLNLAAFQFDGIAACLFDDASGISDGLPGADLVAHEGHIDHDQCTADGAGDEFSVVEHLGERYGEGAGTSLDDHCQTIADEDAVDAGVIENAGPKVIVGGEHCQATSGPGLFAEGRNGYFADRLGHGGVG